MKRQAPLAALAALSLVATLATGCATVTYSSPGQFRNVSVKGAADVRDARHVVITTSGCNLLWLVPLGSGDLRWDSVKRDIRGGTQWFADQVGFQELHTALQKIAESRNCDLADVSFNDADEFYADERGLRGLLRRRARGARRVISVGRLLLHAPDCGRRNGDRPEAGLLSRMGPRRRDGLDDGCARGRRSTSWWSIPSP